MEELKIGQIFCTIPITYETRFNKMLYYASAGNIVAMQKVAIAYAKGDSVEIDTKESIKWLKKLAKLNDAWGLKELGRWYERADSLEHDLYKALECYEKALALGHTQLIYDVDRIKREISKD